MVVLMLDCDEGGVAKTFQADCILPLDGYLLSAQCIRSALALPLEAYRPLWSLHRSKSICTSALHGRAFGLVRRYLPAS